jgi:hypothetical protein
MVVLTIGVGLVGLLLLYTVVTIPRSQYGFYHDQGAGLFKDRGKVVVLYVGAQSCSLCAAERWAIVGALANFGNWSNLQESLSGPPSVEPQFPNIPTYSFVNASYSGENVSFQAVELRDRAGNPFQQLAPVQQSLFEREDPSGSIPFLSVGGEYYKLGTGVNVTLFVGMNFTQAEQAVASGRGPISDSVRGESQNIASTLSIVLRAAGEPAVQTGQLLGPSFVAATLLTPQVSRRSSGASLRCINKGRTANEKPRAYRDRVLEHRKLPGSDHRR